MHLTDHDIEQLNSEYLSRLDQAEQLLSFSNKMADDLKELIDRFRRDSSNSSCPPSSDDPWKSRGTKSPDKDNQVDPDEHSDSTPDSDRESSSTPHEDDQSENKKRKKGRQPESQGFGRTQQLPIDHEVVHRAGECLGCGTSLKLTDLFQATTARTEIDLEKEDDTSLNLKIVCTKHIYGEVTCPCCGHKNLEMPKKAPDEDDWKVELQEWRLVGPMLVAFICGLSKRYRLSRQKIREFLYDWFSLSLSVGEINRCIHEAGRAVSPLEEELMEAVRNSDLIHVDETPWWEHTKRLWLWVFTSATVVFFMVGSRSNVIPKKVLEGFIGWLMSDGYCTYRNWLKRLRCWAHLIRKAKGLNDSTDAVAKNFGNELLELLKALQTAVYDARAGPHRPLDISQNNTLNRMLRLCWKHQESGHEKVRALSREILRDWIAIFMVLEHPNLPLTNNEAERALRHWVIQRRISMGTRSPEGTKVFTLLASVIETCRKRGVSPWPYLAAVIKERRRGNPCPKLPIPQASDQAA